MKNVITKSFVCALGILLLSVVSFGQAAKRIDFKQGPSLVWEEPVAANSTKSFVFYAKKGQILKLSMVDDTDAGSMDLGKVSVEPNADPMEMTIEVTKDYNLSVTNNTRKATSFRIMISLDDAPIETEFDPNGEGVLRIEFAKGESSGDTGPVEILANGSRDILIYAKKGQTLGFQVSYEGRAADVQAFLTEPGLQDMAMQTGPEARREFKVKKTGEHRITVNNMTKKKISVVVYGDAY